MSKSTQKFIESLVQIVFWVIKTFFSIIGWTLKLIYKFFVSLFSSDTFDWFSFLPRIRKKRINQKEKVNVNINLEKMDLDDWWDNYRKDQKHFSNKKYVDEKKLTKEFKSSCRGKIGKRGTPSIIEEFRGYEYYPDFDNDETEFWEGYLSEWRRKVCSNEEIISEFELWDFHRNYFSVDQSYRKITIDELLDSRGQMKFEMMKLMRDEVGSYIKERKSFYDDFGRESEYYISEGLISKFKNLK